MSLISRNHGLIQLPPSSMCSRNSKSSLPSYSNKLALRLSITKSRFSSKSGSRQPSPPSSSQRLRQKALEGNQDGMCGVPVLAVLAGRGECMQKGRAVMAGRSAVSVRRVDHSYSSAAIQAIPVQCRRFSLLPVQSSPNVPKLLEGSTPSSHLESYKNCTSSFFLAFPFSPTYIQVFSLLHILGLISHIHTQLHSYLFHHD